MSEANHNYELLQKCLKEKNINDIAKTLNIAKGTVKRWLELKNVPRHYTFDFMKMSNIPINYNEFPSVMKDQFFTPEIIARKCWNTFLEKVKIKIDEYVFIEPSAGEGTFLRILPKGSIGIDIEPRSEGILQCDYLNWKPNEGTKYIVFGNPPFGLRGHLALNFLNHSKFAEYVCFILPQLFESDGKGSPLTRVEKLKLIFSEKVSGFFSTPEKDEIKVNGVFQIWTKEQIVSPYFLKKERQNKVKVYSLSDGGTASSTRNKNMINNCDFYVPSTCFGKDKMKMYNSFEELPGRKGYGVVFLQDKDTLLKRAQNIEWSNVSFLSTNSAYNIRTSIIEAQFLN
jgi:hypothetical protein